MANQSTSKPLTILRRKQLEARLGLSRTTIYERMKSDPTFPKQVAIGPRSVGWLEHEVEAWIGLQAAKREGGRG